MSLDHGQPPPPRPAGRTSRRCRTGADESRGADQAYDFLASVLEHVGDGLHVIDEQRRIGFMNPAGAAMLGYGVPGELVGLPVHETIHHKHPDGSEFPADQCSHLTVFDTGQATRGEDWLVRKDGSMLPIAYSSAPIPLPAGRGVVVVFRDVSELTRMRLEREVEREFLDAVLESLDVGIVACDSQGVLSVFNRATREMHGLPAMPPGPDEWVSRYSLFMSDGRTPLRSEQVPLFRALRGECVRDLELVIAAQDRPPRTMLCNGQPIRSKDGRALGAVVAMHDVTERRRAEEELAHRALHDSLTGLPNRALLLDRLGHALAVARRHGGSVTVLSVDLDHFKLVNDNLGHQRGDELLVAVAARLSTALRSSDTVGRPVSGTVARLGGDEFVVLCEGSTSDERGAARIAERISGMLAEPFDLGGDEVFSSASIGIAVGGPGSVPDSLLRDADTAMYRAKKRGRGRYELFDETMRKRLIDRLRRETALRRAIAQDEIRLHYQPIVSLTDGRFAAVEALARWEHPERGLLAPAEFIELAEESGLIAALGSWVMRESCRQIVRWERSIGLDDAPQVSVNISAHQLSGPRLLDEVEHALSAAGADPERLALEITETVLMEDEQTPDATLQTLKRLGARLVLDDFGTGYSSLSYLARLPLDTLKLDRSFVAALGPDGQGRAIAAAVVDLAHALGMTIVAEGVETEDQLRLLQTLNCDFAQGYLFAGPLPAAEMTELLAAQARGARLRADAH